MSTWRDRPRHRIDHSVSQRLRATTEASWLDRQPDEAPEPWVPLDHDGDDNWETGQDDQGGWGETLV